jgi:hypothetical protein
VEFDRQAQAIKDAIAREASVAPVAAQAPATPEPGSETEATVIDAGEAGPVSPDAVPEPSGAEAGAEEVQEAARERIALGDDDDLLADVDSGVNENEFKW